MRLRSALATDRGCIEALCRWSTMALAEPQALPHLLSSSVADGVLPQLCPGFTKVLTYVPLHEGQVGIPAPANLAPPLLTDGRREGGRLSTPLAA
jgi:hypothetical protein